MKIKLLYLPIVITNYEKDLMSTTEQVDDDLRIEMPFTYEGHKGSLIYDRNHPAEMQNSFRDIFYTLKIDSQSIDLPSLIKTKHRFNRIKDVEVDVDDTLCCSTYVVLGFWLNQLGLLTPTDKIEIAPPDTLSLPEDKDFIIKRKQGEISKVILPVNLKDKNWGIKLIDFLLEDRLMKPLDLKNHPEFFQSVVDFLNNFTVEINERDYNNLIPRDLYAIEDYDFKEYIESNDFFDINSADANALFDDSRWVNSTKREYKAQIDRLDKYHSTRSKNRKGTVTAEELIRDNLDYVMTYITQLFAFDFEEKYSKLFKGQDPYKALEKFYGDKPINVLLEINPDFWEEAEKALQKDLDKNPYPEDLMSEGYNIKDYLKGAKKFNYFAQDAWDDLIDVYEEQNE